MGTKAKSKAINNDQDSMMGAVDSFTRLLNTSQAALYLGCSQRFLEAKRIQGGGPPYIQLSGKAIRYDREALDGWLKERVRTSTSDNGSVA